MLCNVKNSHTELKMPISALRDDYSVDASSKKQMLIL